MVVRAKRTKRIVFRDGTAPCLLLMLLLITSFLEFNVLIAQLIPPGLGRG
jgi:hypothetical protein